jgi:hypothetical protein
MRRNDLGAAEHRPILGGAKPVIVSGRTGRQAAFAGDRAEPPESRLRAFMPQE